MWRTCATHGQRANYADVAFAIPPGWPDGLGPEGKLRVPEYVACGCLSPVNFGRGEAKA